MTGLSADTIKRLVRVPLPDDYKEAFTGPEDRSQGLLRDPRGRRISSVNRRKW
jgi:hypothetical protein